MTGTTQQRPHFDRVVVARALRTLVTSERNLNEHEFVALLGKQVGREWGQSFFEDLFEGCLVGIHVSSSRGHGTKSRKGSRIGRVVITREGADLLQEELEDEGE
jgi:hypothetical protein